MSEQFNATGPQRRDCPLCMRTGTLTGDLVEGATLECTGGMAPGRSGDLAKGGCCALFKFTAPATLTRLPTPIPERPLYLHLQDIGDEDLERARGGAAWA